MNFFVAYVMCGLQLVPCAATYLEVFGAERLILEVAVCVCVCAARAHEPVLCCVVLSRACARARTHTHTYTNTHTQTTLYPGIVNRRIA